MLYNVILLARLYRWGHFLPSYTARPFGLLFKFQVKEPYKLYKEAMPKLGISTPDSAAK